MPVLLLDDEIDPNEICYYDDFPKHQKRQYSYHLKKPYYVWRENFMKDRCIERNDLTQEFLIASTPHILLNVLLLIYIIFGAFFLRAIDDNVKKENMREAILFAYTTITTIGYGNVYPTSQTGKIGCMLYCVVGIPLIFLVLSNNGQFLGEAFWILRNSFSNKKVSPASKELPLWMTGLLLVLHSLIGGLIFSFWIDQMRFVPAVYFSFISIATIGYGDLTPTPEDWFQIVVIIVYMSAGIVILSTLLGSLSTYLQWIYNIGRPIAGSKDIEVWFGGNMLTVEELVTMVADQFGVSPLRLGAVMQDLDEILRVACESDDNNQQTENLRKLSKRESCAFNLNAEVRSMLMNLESPNTSLTLCRLPRTCSDSNLHQAFTSKETGKALQALRVIQHTLKEQRRAPGDRSPMQSRQSSLATATTAPWPGRVERHTSS